ncbi:MAG: AarF/ABC1/UbiB kinase family protein [Myxococcales bacterium]|nr:AarF/ABC1/UbiB kinase family protein [Myxococcales bacterium]
MTRTPSLLHTVRDLGRLREITAVLARHGFGELVERTGLSSLLAGKAARQSGSNKLSTAERIRRVLEELGPSFVKLGQIVSTRPDLVPPDIIRELEKLQDDVPPLPFEQMLPELELQLGAPIAELFSEFNRTPIASASIGQVYRAKLRTEGEDADVVVKIQRPQTSATIERDIDLLYWLAHAIERSVPEAKLYSPVKLVDEFDRAINAELDYALEADNAERFAENLAGHPNVRFPKVYRQASSRKVITLSFLEGGNVFEAVEQGASGERIAQVAIEVSVRMIFEHGFFHADPHPGNILISGTPDQPILGLIDLGLVGRLTPRLRDRLVDLVLAVGREDPRAVADALYAIGRPTKKIDRAAYETEVSRLCDKYLGKNLGDIVFAEMIRDLAGGAMRYGLEVPPDFLMVGKALMTVEGIARQIVPGLNLADELKPHFLDVLGYRYSPERLTSDLLLLATRFRSAASELPARADEILEDLRQGRLSMEVKQPSVQYANERLGRRIFAGLVLAGALVSAAILVGLDKPHFAWPVLGAAALWGFLHAAAMALGKNRPPR